MYSLREQKRFPTIFSEMKQKMVAVEIVPSGDRVDIYIKDEDGRQHTMTVSKLNEENKTAFSFDGVSPNTTSID